MSCIDVLFVYHLCNMEMPKNINVRSPLAIKRCHDLVKSGDARNYSEAADTLILIGSQSERRSTSGGDESARTSNVTTQPVAQQTGAT